MTADDVLTEYDAGLATERDTPAKRWCLEHPPTREDAGWVISGFVRSLVVAV